MIDDISHVRFQVPDLELAADFLADFGLTCFIENDTLFARGTGTAPYVYMASQGEPRFVALGLRTDDQKFLADLAAKHETQVVVSNRPGGGRMAILTDPDGFMVEICTGQEYRPAGELPEARSWNTAHGSVRRFEKRVEPGASKVVRLGHCVLNVGEFDRSLRWYRERFGMIVSDEILDEHNRSIGAFLRMDHGNNPTDHHTLFIVEGRGVSFNHAAYEVVDLDDLFAGHEKLAEGGWRRFWGIGRHKLGSQVFDYWEDPWGHVFEHWTDGDRLISEDGSRQSSMDELRSVQWGSGAPVGHGGDEA